MPLPSRPIPGVRPGRPARAVGRAPGPGCSYPGSCDYFHGHARSAQSDHSGRLPSSGRSIQRGGRGRLVGNHGPPFSEFARRPTSRLGSACLLCQWATTLAGTSFARSLGPSAPGARGLFGRSLQSLEAKATCPRCAGSGLGGHSTSGRLLISVRKWTARCRDILSRPGRSSRPEARTNGCPRAPFRLRSFGTQLT